MHSSPSFHSQRGNIFFYILLAIVLIASLTYAVTRENRGNTDIFTDQQTKLAAQEMIEFGNTMVSAVQKLRLRGCQETEISFTNTIYKTNNNNDIFTNAHNANAPVDGSCDIFSINGANLTPSLFPVNNLQDWPGITATDVKPGSITIVRSEAVGTGDAAREDVLLIIPYVRRSICLKINDILGVINPSDAVPATTNTQSTYHGNFDDNGSNAMADDDGALNRKGSFCAQHSTGDAWDNFYAQVLLSR